MALGACSYINPFSAARLSAIDPMQADPEQIAVIADLPDWAYIPEGGAYFDVTSARSDTGQSLHERFVLEETETRDGMARFTVAEADLARLRRVQKTAGLWEAEAPRANQGSFSVRAQGCARPGETADFDDTFSVLIQTATDTPPMPLMRDVPVRKLLEFIEENPAPTQEPQLCPKG